jgi:hypothetical protein
MMFIIRVDELLSAFWATVQPVTSVHISDNVFQKVCRDLEDLILLSVPIALTYKRYLSVHLSVKPFLRYAQAASHDTQIHFLFCVLQHHTTYQVSPLSPPLARLLLF